MTIGAVGYSANFEFPQQPTALILNLRSSLQRGFIEIFEQLRENEREKKILLASKSGAHIEYIHEKNRDQKISRYCPFKVFLPLSLNITILQSIPPSIFHYRSHVLAVQSLLFFSSGCSCCPILTTSGLFLLFYLEYPTCPVLSQLFCRVCSVLVFLSCCPVLAVVLPLLFFPDCSVLVFLS